MEDLRQENRDLRYLRIAREQELLVQRNRIHRFCAKVRFENMHQKQLECGARICRETIFTKGNTGQARFQREQNTKTFRSTF